MSRAYIRAGLMTIDVFCPRGPVAEVASGLRFQLSMRGSHPNLSIGPKFGWLAGLGQMM